MLEIMFCTGIRMLRALYTVDIPLGTYSLPLRNVRECTLSTAFLLLLLIAVSVINSTDVPSSDTLFDGFYKVCLLHARIGQPYTADVHHSALLEELRTVIQRKPSVLPKT